jgi:hypothetical protein
MKGRTLSDQNKGSSKSPSTKMFAGGALKGALSKLSQKTGKDLSGAFAKKASSNIFDKVMNKAIAAGKLDPAKLHADRMNVVEKFMSRMK